MTPTRSQLLQTLTDKHTTEYGNVITNMKIYLMRLRKNISTIQSFYKIHDLDSMM